MGGMGIGNISHGAWSPKKVRLRFFVSLQDPLFRISRIHPSWENVGGTVQPSGKEVSLRLSSRLARAFPRVEAAGTRSFRVRTELVEAKREARDCMEEKPSS